MNIALYEIQNLSKIVTSLEQRGYRKTYIEKALSLPFGTINEWLSFNNIDFAGIQLFKILNLYPRMIDLADCNYNVAEFNSL